MARRLVGTNWWISLMAGLVLVLWSISSTIGSPWTPDGHLCTGCPDSPSGELVSATVVPGTAFTSNLPCGEFIDADHSEIIGESEDDWFCPLSHLVSPAFLAPDGLVKVHSGPAPGSSSLRIVAVPLRC